MAPRFQSYADTAALDDAALREAAAAGTATDRVLACWRLMTRGQAIRTIAELGPDAGVRRLLLLGLASSRELDLLVVIGRNDPDPHIRLEALRWVVRVADQAALPTLLGPCLVAERDADVLVELLGPLSMDPIAALRPALERLLYRASTGLRRLVADRLLDLGPGFPDTIEAAIARETDPYLKGYWLGRWATSNDHARLFNRAITTPTLLEPALHSLGLALRRYPFEQLAPLLAACPASSIVQVLGPPYSDAAQRWLCAQAQQCLDEDDAPEPMLEVMRFAYEGADLTTFPARDRTLVELLTGGHPTDRDELERLLACASDRLRNLAARAIARLDGALSPELRTLALDECNLHLLDLWAASDAHRELLDAVASVDEYGSHLHYEALAALARAGCTYPWIELAGIVEAMDATEGWYVEYTELGDLIALIARPWPPAARAWALGLDAGFTLGDDARRRRLDALLEIPEDERSPEEQAWLAQPPSRREPLHPDDLCDPARVKAHDPWPHQLCPPLASLGTIIGLTRNNSTGLPPVAPAPVAPAPVPPAPAAPMQQTPSTAATDLVGPATVDVLLHGSERATFVVDAKSFSKKDSAGPARFAGYQVVRRGRALTDDEHRRLVALLLDEHSYLPIEKEVCFQDEAYGLRVTHGAEVVELLFVFPCDRVNFLRRASADTQRMPGEYIDPVAPQVLAIFKDATRP